MSWAELVPHTNTHTPGRSYAKKPDLQQRFLRSYGQYSLVSGMSSADPWSFVSRHRLSSCRWRILRMIRGIWKWYILYCWKMIVSLLGDDAQATTSLLVMSSSLLTGKIVYTSGCWNRSKFWRPDDTTSTSRKHTVSRFDHDFVSHSEAIYKP